MNPCIQLSERDNIAVALRPLSRGETLTVAGRSVCLQDDIDFGHKFALCEIPAGADVLKYGLPIGHATAPVHPGQWVHVHNLASNYMLTRK